MNTKVNIISGVGTVVAEAAMAATLFHWTFPFFFFVVDINDSHVLKSSSNMRSSPVYILYMYIYVTVQVYTFLQSNVRTSVCPRNHLFINSA